MYFYPNINYNVAKLDVYSMANMVKNAVSKSIAAVIESQPQKAKQVIQERMLVHSFEIDIEETIKNTFPLGKLPSQWHNQMMSIHKVSALLGRIENHAVNIAESAAALINKSEEISLYLVQIYISKMADITETLLGDSLNCFFHPDGIVARRIQNSDNQFCALIQSMTNRIKDMVLKETIPFESAVELSHIFKNLEQIAENSVTIAEKVNCAELQKSPTKFIGGSHQAVSHRDTISAEKV